MSYMFYGDIGHEPSLDPPEDKREILGFCRECGEPIREGDDFVELWGYQFCEICVNNAWRCG